MLKDKKIINAVIDENKVRKAELFMKLLRLLKSISKEYKDPNLKPVSIREGILEQVRAYYKGLPLDENHKAHMIYLKDLAHYCGQDITQDELVYLARSCVKVEIMDF